MVKKKHSSNPLGRPTKFTPETRKRILDVIAVGASATAAAAHADIDYSTLRNWLIAGQNATEGEYFDFFTAYTRAQQKAELAAVTAFRGALTQQRETSTKVEEFSETRLDKDGKPYTYTRRKASTIETIIPPDWRAAMEWLQRRNRKRWSLKTLQDITSGGKPIGATTADSISTLGQLLAARERQLNAADDGDST